MVDRTKAPKLQETQVRQLPEPDIYYLNNKIPVYCLNMGIQEIVKLEIVFHAGRPYEHKPLVSRTTNTLIKEGTKQYNAAYIAETIEFYGCTLEIPVNLDTNSIIVYSLTKHFDKVLPLVIDMLVNPAFVPQELKNYIRRRKKKLQVDLAKNDIVAYRELTANLFGKSHPYGYNSNEQLYEELTVEDLHQHAKGNYYASNCSMFLSGHFPKTILKEIEAYFSELPDGPSKTYGLNWTGQLPTPHKTYFENNKSSQTAIRIGRRLFNKQHDDYAACYVLNNIIGGYFGSRLVSNVREDKGYTYNIYSSIDPMMYDGYFYIGTEVGKESTKEALKEIYHELEVLGNEKIGDKELEMTKNYLKGTLLTNLDGLFNVSDMVKTQVLEGGNLDLLRTLTATIERITPQELQDLVQRYFQKDQLFEVVVGTM